MTTASSPPAFLTEHIELIEGGLRKALAVDNSPLAAAARYVMGWEDEHGAPANARGKRLRPSLCLLAGEAFGAPPEAALPGAVAVELIHNFSLVHDEIQDRDAERHYRPTTWALLGEAQAINVGDYLYTSAIRTLTEALIDAEPKLAALSMLNAAITAMIHGQWEDLSFEADDAVTTSRYIAMIRGKTGALFAAPLGMGALLAGADPTDAELVRRWGEQLGLAFQVQDDYLGVWGTPADTGKSNTNDIARRKKSLPVIKGLEHPEAAPLIREAFAAPAGPAPSQVTAIIAGLDAAGIADECRAYASQLAGEASAMLALLPVSPVARTRLAEVATYFATRSA